MKQNALLEALYGRHSVRSYLPDPVSEQDLQTILDAGIHAPSANNLQPWHISVIRDKALIDTINAQGAAFMAKERPELATRVSVPDYSAFYHAPCLLLVSYENERSWGQFDCALFTQNVCLAAHSLGLGTCIIGMYTPFLTAPEAAELMTVIGPPAGFTPLHFIALGKPTVQPAARDRRNDRIRYI